MTRKKLQGDAPSGLQLQFYGDRSQIAVLRLNRGAKVKKG